MPISLEGTDAGRVIAQRGRAKGRDEGRVEGRNEGESAVLAELLTARFGTDERIPLLARRLAEAGEKAAVAAVLAASSLDDLAT